MRIGIIPIVPESSPLVLAQSLGALLGREGVEAEILPDVSDQLRRQLPLRTIWTRPSWSVCARASAPIGKALYAWKRQKRLAEIASFDALVLCDRIPNAFRKDHVVVTELRRRFPGKPLALHEVYYLGNAPTMADRLNGAGDHGIERFDWHLAVSEVTEVRGKPSPPWSVVGLYLEDAGLRPMRKPGFRALIDFPQPGYDAHRQAQLQVLDELGIKTDVLDGRYELAEIRSHYAEATIYMLQGMEAFGVPIAECLSLGAKVFTPDSSWPMSFRLDKDPRVHGPGRLADCFTVYRDAGDLRRKLIALRDTFDPGQTPKQVFSDFVESYPHFYRGNAEGVREFLRFARREAPANDGGGAP